jgi:predicted kinase
MQHIQILIGISGSGKSTYARQFVQDNPTYLRLNRDDLRRSLIPVPLNDYWRWDSTRKGRIERAVSTLEKTALTAALDGGWNILLDNTHLRRKYITDVLKQVANRPVTVTFRCFDVPVEEAIRRDAARPDVVGEVVIREQQGRYENLKTIFDTSQTLVFPKPPATPANVPGSVADSQNETLPRCILVDIDGTIASMQGRSPFDWRNVHLDAPKRPVINVVKALRAAGYVVIFLSGRDSVARADTIDWIRRHISWEENTDYQLHMRAANDNRKDSVIKRELFEANIQGRFFVEVVLDDRDQVVALWRNDLGLTCLQVDYGNF